MFVFMDKKMTDFISSISLESTIKKYRELLSQMSIYNTNYELYKDTLFLLLEYQELRKEKKDDKY